MPSGVRLARGVLIAHMNRGSGIALGATALWFVAVCLGGGVLQRYEQTPGAAANAPAIWPDASGIARAAGHSTLVMFVHPRCPCSSASLEELGRIMAALDGAVSAHVLFLRPEDAADAWADTSSRRAAAAIRGVHVRSDDRGVESSRFGAVTSGQTVVYDPAGRLLFSGGVTASRGQVGESAGGHAIVALVRGADAARADAPVFGCSLVDPPPPREPA